MAQIANPINNPSEFHAGRAGFREREPDVNTVGVYLRQIGAFRLLTQDQEREIARRIQASQAEMVVILLGHADLLRDARPDLDEERVAALRTRTEGLVAFRRQLGSMRLQGHEEAALLEKEEENLDRLQGVFRDLDLDDAGLDRFMGRLRASLAGAHPRRAVRQPGGTGVAGDPGAAERRGRKGPRRHEMVAAAGDERRFAEDLTRMVIARRELHQARTAFIEANLRLVVSVARRYTHLGLALPDLIQEGNLGLIKAIDRFDYRRGNKVSTYAIWWIRQYILRALQKNAQADRVPASPTEPALGQEVVGGLSRTPVATGAEAVGGKGPGQRAPAGVRLSRGFHFVRGIRLASLEAPVGDGLYPLRDLIPDESAISPEEVIVQRIRAEKAQQALETLSPREAEILRRRFGIGDGKEETLQELSRTFGITRERVRQIETMALQKLRKADHARRLASYLG